MNSVAHPYAQALFMHANKENKLNIWLDLLKQLKEISNNPDFVFLITNPKINATEIAETVSLLTANKDPHLINFIKLLVYNKRVKLLASIYDIFENLCNDFYNSETAIIESAYKLTDEQIKLFESLLSEKYNLKITVVNKVNIELIGGVRIMIKDLQIDASILGGIHKMTHSIIA